MAKEEQFEHESYQDARTIGNYLRSLLEGFEKGRITFESETESIELIPAELVRFSVKAKRKGDKNKLNIKIAWKEDKAAETGDKIAIS